MSIVEEMAGSPRWTTGREGASAEREVAVLWANINALNLALFPPPIGGVAQFPQLFTGAPMLAAALYAESAQYEPFMGAEDVPISEDLPAAYEVARVTISYSTQRPGEQSGDQIISRRISVGGQVMTIPNVGLKWKDTGEVVDHPDVMGGKIIGTIEHEVTLYQVTTVPFATIRGLVGTVNNAAFEGAAAGTLLFQGTEIQEQIASDGSTVMQVTLRFTERNVDADGTITWNHVYDYTAKEGEGAWREIVQLDGTSLYVESNFSGLL